MFQRLRAARSAASTALGPGFSSFVSFISDLPIGEVMASEFVAMRAFWSLILVFSRLSNVDRCFLMALPFAASALAAAEILERTFFCDSAIILRI